MNFNKSFKYFLVLVILSVISCCRTNDDLEEINTQISDVIKFKAKYMEFPRPLAYLPNESEPEIVELEYNNKGQVVKKNGDILFMSASSGVPYALSKTIYAQVHYDNDKIMIEKKFFDPNVYSSYRKEIFMNNNQIEKIITYTGQSSIRDTVVFTYNNQKITKTIKRNIYPKEEALYYYTEDNLDSIVTRGYRYDPVTDEDYIDYNAKGRDKVIFSNYDKYSNPTKKLIIFDETYFRSLSKNNYQKIIFKSIWDDGSVHSNYEESWNLKYKNGQVDFSQ